MKQPSEMTFKITAVLIGVSAVFELTTVSTSVLFFGTILITPSVMLYHLSYMILFTVLGFGLWYAKAWGYVTLWLTLIVYVVDRLQLAMSPALLREYIMMQLQSYDRILKLLQMDMALLEQSGMLDVIVFSMQIMGFTMAACWLGFGVYAYKQRGYFGMGRGK